MKRFLLDALIILGGTAFFAYAKLIATSGFEHIDKWLLPLLYTIYFGGICLIVFEVTMRLFKSRLLFFIVSGCVTIALLAFNIVGAREGSVTLREMGIDIFVDGEITLVGALYKLVDPVGVMALVAAVMLAAQLRAAKLS